MIHYKTGDLLQSDAQALVNAVNTVGVMGKGIALLFKNTFPLNYRIYKQACKEGELTVGKLLATEDSDISGIKKIIINFPTKKDWRNPSEYSYIEAGLEELVQLINTKGIRSIAIPALGTGNGGLQWELVKKLIEQYLGSINCNVFVYLPA